MPLFHTTKRNELEPGTHIYVWRNIIYAHHGIYIGDDLVIHFTGPAQDLEKCSFNTLSGFSGSGRSISTASNYSGASTSSSSKESTSSTFASSKKSKEEAGIILSSLDEFLQGGTIKTYKYGCSSFEAAIKLSGTCCIHEKDDSSVTVKRAWDFLESGYIEKYGDYHVRYNNCEIFALRCCLGVLLVDDRGHLIPRQGLPAIVEAALYPLRVPFRLASTTYDYIQCYAYK